MALAQAMLNWFTPTIALAEVQEAGRHGSGDI
jgi:hypothetical protein